jgi:hypothetical protein
MVDEELKCSKRSEWVERSEKTQECAAEFDVVGILHAEMHRHLEENGLDLKTILAR